jgi:putative FmdB family regulatory protein
MPSYEMTCDACRHQWEDILPVAEYLRVVKGKCPECGKRALRQVMHPAVLKTATNWLRGRGMLADQFGKGKECEAQLHYRINEARKAGYNPSPNDSYDPTLAGYPGDPDGFIPHDDPAGHIRRVCAKRGVGCDTDIVKVSAPMRDPGPPAPLAEDLVRDLAIEKIKKNPDLKRKTKNELREMVRAEHSYQ